MKKLGCVLMVAVLPWATSAGAEVLRVPLQYKGMFMWNDKTWYNTTMNISRGQVLPGGVVELRGTIMYGAKCSSLFKLLIEPVSSKIHMTESLLDCPNGTASGAFSGGFSGRDLRHLTAFWTGSDKSKGTLGLDFVTDSYLKLP
jgi:hypothetical protein